MGLHIPLRSDSLQEVEEWGSSPRFEWISVLLLLHIGDGVLMKGIVRVEFDESLPRVGSIRVHTHSFTSIPRFRVLKSLRSNSYMY